MKNIQILINIAIFHYQLRLTMGEKNNSDGAGIR